MGLQTIAELDDLQNPSKKFQIVLNGRLFNKAKVIRDLKPRPLFVLRTAKVVKKETENTSSEFVQRIGDCIAPLFTDYGA